ncbi:MAG: DUF1015 domain-containing protein [Anaerolineaceae bacterium]|jgi:hypothetical protein
MINYPQVGVQIPTVLLPKAGIDLHRWAVIACDQYTAQPDYWRSVEEIVGNSPSTYHLVLPEIYLDQPEEEQRIHRTQQKMREYLAQGLFVPYEGLILVERSSNGKTRHGLMLALDLERYDYNQGSQSLIRATEGTILERLPPRIKIRQDAMLELPHILALIDDDQNHVIAPLLERKTEFDLLYDFELMLGSGHLRGFGIQDERVQQQVLSALENLASPEEFNRRYQLAGQPGVMLFAMGDGNHSLATAKAIWEQIKPQVGPNHPARYALVEIENVHDAGLHFEPIHRVLFGVKGDVMAALQRYFGDRMQVAPCQDSNETLNNEHAHQDHVQTFGVIMPAGASMVRIYEPETNLAVATLQRFLDQWMKAGGAEKIDYVHGDEVVARLGSQPSNAGFLLPAMHKSELFKTVILDGALPRKTFSMGEAHEKRFYMECRQIVP